MAVKLKLNTNYLWNRVVAMRGSIESRASRIRLHPVAAKFKLPSRPRTVDDVLSPIGTGQGRAGQAEAGSWSRLQARAKGLVLVQPDAGWLAGSLARLTCAVEGDLLAVVRASDVTPEDRAAPRHSRLPRLGLGRADQHPAIKSGPELDQIS